MRKGFTMIEILIIIAIVGMLASMVLTVLTGVEELDTSVSSEQYWKECQEKC